MADKLQQPGDSKSTADKLVGDAKSVGQNVVDTGSHYADKSGATDAANTATAKAESVGQNVADTATHYADKADKEASGNTGIGGTGVGAEKTYLEQAQDVAANVLNTASKAASDLASSISGEKK